MSAVVPLFDRPPPLPVVAPPLIDSPLSVAATPLSTWNTLSVPPPLIVRRPAPGPSITSGPEVSESISVSASVIVWGVENTDGSKPMTVPFVAVLASAFARKTTNGSVPDVPEPEMPPLVELTV